MYSMALTVFSCCLLLGSVVGVLSGLLGIGGGILVVPALLWGLPLVGIEPNLVMPIALATSLASIVFTTSSAAFSHFKSGNVKPELARIMLPCLMLGSAIGSTAAHMMDKEILTKIFGAIMLFLCLRMLRLVDTGTSDKLPAKPLLIFWQLLIGTLSSLAGIGGVALNVPLLAHFGVNLQKAIGTASLGAAALSIVGSISFIIAGLHAESVPDFSLGYVYLPALLGIIMTSTTMSRFGVRIGRNLETKSLKKVFATFLLLVGVKMLLG